jgi:copper(I)-binding protein
MLMQPAKPLAEGARARIRLVLADGRRIAADFVVRREAPPAP